MSELRLSVQPPAYRAKWLPIFLEPIAGSGERIAVGVMVADLAGREVVRTVRDDVLKVLFGSKRAHLSKMIDTTLTALRAQGDRDQFALPVGGFSVGNWSEASSRQERYGVLRQAVYRSCALASLEDLDGDEDDVATAVESTKQWLSQVRAHVIEARPELAGSFNREVALIDNGMPPRIGFLNHRKGANFETLRPVSLAVSVRAARGKLYELVKIKQRGVLDEGRLIIGSPRMDDLTYGERVLASTARALAELEHEAAEDGLLVRPAHSVEQAAREVLELAA